MSNPKQIMDDLEEVENGWGTNAPDDELNDIKFADYKTQVEKSRDVRRRIIQNELENAALLNERDETDKVSWEMRGDVVNGAKLSRKHGKNSTLYQSFGYKREEDYDSGLTRKSGKDDEPGEDK